MEETNCEWKRIDASQALICLQTDTQTEISDYGQI